MGSAILYLSSFLLTVGLIFLFKSQAKKIGLVDYPCDRKRHCGEVPLVGGIAIFVAFSIVVLAAQTSFPGVAALVLGSMILVTIGAMDDIKALKSSPKFAAQIIAASLMCLWGGVVLRDLGVLSFDNSFFTLGSLAIPFTIFAAVGVMNAINMSDGLDGLSGSLILVALTGLSIVTFVAGAKAEFATIFVLLSAVCAFLVFNIRFPGRTRALVFLGDSGSLFTGFALAWFVISLSQGPERVMAPVTALWFLAIPLFDTVGIMLRRLLKGHSPFRADREHFHHAFQLAGFSVLRTQLTITGAAIICMTVGLVGEFAGVPEIAMFYLFLGVFALYFWGMMRAWKFMRFLRRTMSHDVHEGAVNPVQDNVAVANSDAKSITPLPVSEIKSSDQSSKPVIASHAKTAKVPLKLVVSHQQSGKSNEASQSIEQK